MSEDEMEKYKIKDRQEEAGTCIMGEMRKDREEEPEEKIKQLEEALANSLEINESHQKLNGKLHSRITELEQDNLELHADNKKISKQIEDQVERARKAGM